MNPTPDHLWGPPDPPRPARSRLGRRLALAGGVGAVLAIGGVAVAQAASAPSPSASASPSASPSASGSAQPKREHTPHLAGTVVSASGNTIVITDREGFQRTIHTSSATKYEDGLTATPAAGTEIVASGTVDSDKTSLAATRVATLPDRPEGGPGRGHWPGGGPGRGGWPGKDGDHPAPPSGTGSPSASPSASPTS